MGWKELIKDVTYKPGYLFESLGEDIISHRMLISLQVEDTYNPGKQIPVIFSCNLPPYDSLGSEDEALKYLRHEIHYMEIHEADEWFRYKGEMIFNPHANDKN